MSCGDCGQQRAAPEPEPPREATGPPLLRGARNWLRAFWFRAYREGITGLAAMVSYNLLLAVFPFVFLVLFVFSQVLRIEGVEAGILTDLQRLFPDVEQGQLNNILRSIRTNSATIGLIAALGSIWIGASFWGAMDTAFCRIYHVRCRGWWEQKRFSLLMLIVVALFLAASVGLPTFEGTLIDSAANLPFGLGDVRFVDNVLLICVTLFLNFFVCCVIYWAVPKGRMPWRAVWPGAFFVTVIAGLANWLFPLYLTNVSGLSRFGSTVGFILIALVWFYVISLTLMAGAVINSLRHEYHDTGTFPLNG